jgi:hypothetical protein
MDCMSANVKPIGGKLDAPPNPTRPPPRPPRDIFFYSFTVTTLFPWQKVVRSVSSRIIINDAWQNVTKPVQFELRLRRPYKVTSCAIPQLCYPSPQPPPSLTSNGELLSDSQQITEKRKWTNLLTMWARLNEQSHRLCRPTSITPFLWFSSFSY